MMIAALVISGFVVAAVALGLYAMVAAPVGYQDEKGFHFDHGTKTPRSKETFALKVSHAKA